MSIICSENNLKKKKSLFQFNQQGGWKWTSATLICRMHLP